MSDPIKAALAEAQRHAVGGDGEPIPAEPIIAAFLRALPADEPFVAHVTFDSGQAYGVAFHEEWAMLAAAVEKAARDEG